MTAENSQPPVAPQRPVGGWLPGEKPPPAAATGVPATGTVTTGAASRTPEQLAYERGKQDAIKKLTTPRMTGYRIACGICWALWTLLFTIGAFTSFGTGSPGPGLLALVLAGLAGWYDYRIWALKARRLTFFLIF
jgi:hypothetical protein